VQDEGDPTLQLSNTTAPLNFTNYNPAHLGSFPCNTAAQYNCGLFITYLDLPSNVTVGPTTGLGTPNLPFPYNNIPVNVACSFCNSGGDNRGAIVFDARGRTTFYQGLPGPIAGLSGGSFSIYNTNLGIGGGIYTSNTFVVTYPYGSIMSFNHG